MNMKCANPGDPFVVATPPRPQSFCRILLRPSPSACLPLNSIVIHRTEFRLFKKSSGGEGKGGGNRCSKTVCPLSCDLFPIQITPSNSSQSGKGNSTEGLQVFWQRLIWIWVAHLSSSKPLLFSQQTFRATIRPQVRSACA